MNRAYSLLTIKAVSDEKRELRGMATTPTPDRMGDVVEPLGVEFKNPMPLLLYHDSERPVGTVEFKRPTKDGIEFIAKLARIDEPPGLKARVEEAWQSVKANLIRGVSIGFRSLEHAIIKETGGLRFLKSEVLELSLVSIPANSEATIFSIKNYDLDRPPASGHSTDKSLSPGVSGTSIKPAKSGFFHSRGTHMKSAHELRQFREQKAARLGELAELFRTDGHEASEEEQIEFDDLTSEIKQLDQDIRMQTYAEMTAKPVEGRSTKSGSDSRSPQILVRKQDPDDKFKGQSYTRLLIAKAIAMLHGPYQAVDVSTQRWGKTHPKLVQYIRAAVAGGGTGSGEWGAELAQSDARFTGDFIEYLYSMTVYDKLPLREIPARVHVKGQDGAHTGYWVGESKPIPMSKSDYSSVELTPLKVAALTVLSMELLEDSQPSAEMLVRDALVESCSQRIDTTFLSATAASAGVSPAGLLNGLTAITPSGTDLAAVRADMQSLIYPFITNKHATGITLVMNPATALALSWMYGSLDQRAFPDINQSGGSLNGMPVVVGENVTAGNIIAIRPQDVWKIGDSGVQISMSREATIEQQDDPTGATDTPVGVTTTNLTNMFQEESVAFKVVRRINFQKRRSTSVVYIQDAEYGGVVS